MSERFDWSKPEDYLFGWTADNIAATDGVPSFSEAFEIRYQGAAYKVEPSQPGPSLDSLNRVVSFVTFGAGVAASWVYNLEFSRDATAWESLPEQFTPYRYTTDAGDVTPHFSGAVLPPGFLTSLAGAGDIDDVLTCRIGIQDPGDTTTHLFPGFVMLVPGLTASQSQPVRGNVFSGSQYR